jgi:hypothetical protein
MSFTTVVAVMCRLIVAEPTLLPDTDCTAEELQDEQIVTDTNQDPRVDMFSCRINSQIGLAGWKSNHPLYFKEEWRIGRIKCVDGHYEIKRRI